MRLVAGSERGFLPLLEHPVKPCLPVQGHPIELLLCCLVRYDDEKKDQFVREIYEDEISK